MKRWRRGRQVTHELPGADPGASLYPESSPRLPAPSVLLPLPRRIWLADLGADAMPVMVASLRGLLGRYNVVVPDSVLREQVYALLQYAGIVVPGGTLEAMLYSNGSTEAE